MSCDCESTLENTGKPGCVPIQKVTKKWFLQAVYANDGTKNKIDLTQTLDAAFWTALINHDDPSKRIYPIGEVKNVSSDKAETIFEEFEDGSKDVVKEGKRSISCLLPRQTTTYLNILKSIGCDEAGAYGVDIDNQLSYSEDVALEAHPMRLDKNSWNPVYGWPTDKTGASIVVNWDFAQDQRDEDIRILSSDDVEGVNLLALEGLKDVTITIISTGQTAIVFDLFTKFGTGKTKIKAKGLLAADFVSADGTTTGKVYNNTDSAAISIISLTEDEGRYTITYSSQTVSDVIRITPKKNGYSFTAKTGTVV